MDRKRNKKHLCVCENCLAAIESHEGSQFTRPLYIDPDDSEEDSKCDWCEETMFDTLYELL